MSDIKSWFFFPLLLINIVLIVFIVQLKQRETRLRINLQVAQMKINRSHIHQQNLRVQSLKERIDTTQKLIQCMKNTIETAEGKTHEKTVHTRRHGERILPTGKPAGKRTGRNSKS